MHIHFHARGRAKVLGHEGYRENATSLENTVTITVKSFNSAWQHDLFLG
jgi:hypothetical protein